MDNGDNRAPNFSINMSRELREEVDAIANNFGFSRSQLIEYAVLEFVSDKDKIAKSIKRESEEKLKVLSKIPIRTKEEIKSGAPRKLVRKDSPTPKKRLSRKEG